MKLLLTVIVIVGALASGARAYADRAPTLVLNTQSGRVGDQIAFSGHGYSAGSIVTLVIGDDGIILSTTRADRRGGIAGSFTAPDRANFTGDRGSRAPVYAVESGTGRESARVAFSYARVSPRELADAVQLSFELTPRGGTAQGATYWALYGPVGSEATAHRLTDPEGDGLYSFSTEAPVGSRLAIRLVRGHGTLATARGPFPGGNTTVLQDWGELTLAADLTLRANLPGRDLRVELTPVGIAACGGIRLWC